MYPRRKFVRKAGGKKIAKMAKGKVTQVQALAKAVKKLQNADKKNAEYLNFTQQGFEQNVQNPVYTVNLSDFSGMISTFGTSANDVNDNKRSIYHGTLGTISILPFS